MLRTGWSNGRKLGLLLLAGALGLAAGWGLDYAGICPIVKKIWTPSWTLFSAGWALLILAAYFAVIDMLGFRKWTFPLIVVGMNSITMYFLAEAAAGWFTASIRTHFGERPFTFLGENWQPFLAHFWVLLAMWLFLYWLYRQRIFIRI
jgi:heparan-alpha-glucosaminide N-acetyltransferase